MVSQHQIVILKETFKMLYKINNKNVIDENQTLTIDNLDGDTIKLSFGKNIT